jgi:hypothetical protein
MKIRNLHKGGEIVSRENKLNLSNFVNGDRFELNYYLTYLLNQFYNNFPEQSEDKMVKQ